MWAWHLQPLSLPTGFAQDPHGEDSCMLQVARGFGVRALHVTLRLCSQNAPLLRATLGAAWVPELRTMHSWASTSSKGYIMGCSHLMCVPDHRKDVTYMPRAVQGAAGGRAAPQAGQGAGAGGDCAGADSGARTGHKGAAGPGRSPGEGPGRGPGSPHRAWPGEAPAHTDCMQPLNSGGSKSRQAKSLLCL